ncbi:hypothetical protein AB0I22_23175 [Streptomyces sp. NPDC050610]|uniref:pPIWI_RE_Y domain-containing protein n=1 Tax=Streptomyces sp. NPDC050610 TaxID=3157097 RepID=UPI0034338498
MEDHDGTAIFVELARVVAGLAAQERMRTFSLPYPHDAQLALDRMVSYCLGQGWTPPKSLPELMSWCREHTAGGLPFQVPPSFVAPETRLIDRVGLMPTRSCLELASYGPRGELEQEAVGLLSGLEARCDSTEDYNRCRRFLMEQPVIVQRDRINPRSRWNRELWNRIKGLYGRADL